MEVLIVDEQDDLKIDGNSVVEVVKNALKLEKAQCDFVTIHFVNKNYISKLHQVFFNDPSPTDCITLPVDEANSPSPCVLGEVFVCPLVAKEYISENPQEDSCVYRETTLYVVHGVLHLLGYLDDPENCALMREKEKLHMDNLTKKLSIIRP